MNLDDKGAGIVPKIRRERGRIAEQRYRQSAKGKATIKASNKRKAAYRKEWMRQLRATSKAFREYEKEYRKLTAANKLESKRKWLNTTPKGLRALHQLPATAPDEVLQLARLIRTIKKEMRRGHK